MTAWIRTGSQLINAVVGERCVIWASVIEDSVVEDDVRIGPFAHVRGGSTSAPARELGNFAEVKDSSIGRGSKQHHFSYIGDADVGEGVNIGAGTITANYDGRASTARPSATGPSSAPTPSCGRRSPSARARTRAPARSSPGTCRPARWRSASRRASAERHADRAAPGHGDASIERPADPVSSSLIIGVLIALNGVLVAAEIALVSVRRSRLQQLIEEGHRGAKRVERLVVDPSRFLAVLQLGVTFVGFLAAAFAGAEHRQVAGGRGWRASRPRQARPRRSPCSW